MSPVQGTKRSHSKKRTVPLPLEVIFRPGAGGTYNPGNAEWVNAECESYNPIKGGFIAEYERSEFVPNIPEFIAECDFTPIDDPWNLRGQILHREGDSDDYPDGGLELFTPDCGRWGIGRDDLMVPKDKFPEDCDWYTARELLGAQVKEWRSLIRAAMTTKMSEWPKLKAKFPAAKVDILCEPMALSVEWKEGRPTGVITCLGILRTLIATLQIDALIGAEYRFCACVGCSNAFKVKRRDQRYCNEDCKHRQVVRDGRERHRKAVEQAKRRDGRGKGK